MIKQKGTLKHCPACGQFFTCYGDDDCWCERVRIPGKEMKIIMNTYKDCLCPGCLQKFEEGQGTRDEGQGTRDKGRGTRDKGQGTRDEGQVRSKE